MKLFKILYETDITIIRFTNSTFFALTGISFSIILSLHLLAYLFIYMEKNLGSWNLFTVPVEEKKNVANRCKSWYWWITILDPNQYGKF